MLKKDDPALRDNADKARPQVPSMIPSISQWPTKKKYRVVFHCLDGVKSTGLNQGEGGPCHAQARETIIWISLAADSLDWSHVLLLNTEWQKYTMIRMKYRIKLKYRVEWYLVCLWVHEYGVQSIRFCYSRSITSTWM